MHIKPYITLACLFAPLFLLCGQTPKDTLTFRVVSYNVENLFDCRHDTLKDSCPTPCATGTTRNTGRNWTT